MDFGEIALKMTTEVMETEDEFIFTTIKTWCEEKTQRKISKRDLENALSGTSIRLTYQTALDNMFDELVQNSISVNNGFFVDLATIKKIYSELSLKNKGEK